MLEEQTWTVKYTAQEILKSKLSFCTGIRFLVKILSSNSSVSPMKKFKQKIVTNQTRKIESAKITQKFD